jgi:glutamate-1-semialdehyde 2,1-aminomutase
MKNLPLDNSMRLYREALDLIPGGSQTMSKRPECFAFGAMPVFLDRGQGCRVWDVDGNEYIDFIGALGPITLGYCWPAVDAAIRAQLERGCVFSMLHEVEVEAARAMVESIPCAEMVRFLKTGAEATSAAARIARAVTGRDLIVSSGYHGWLDTWTAERSGPGGRGVPAALKDTIAGFRFGATGTEDSLEAVLERHRGRVACVFMEPVSYSDPDSGGYLRQVRALTDQHGALLVFDEIVSGFRVALGGAQEHFDVTPDLACFAKGMSNGLPVAAVVGRRDIMQVAKDLVISSTYGGEALSLAAVVACIREYRTHDVIGHLRDVGTQLVDGLNALAQDAAVELRFVGFPMMSAFSFGYDDPEHNADLMTLFPQEMARRGILLRRGGLIFISFSHREEHVQQTLRACAEVLPILKQAHDAGNVTELLVSQDQTAQAGIRRF